LIAVTDVHVNWIAPNDHYSTIDLYEVLFLKADGSYGKDLVNCDGNDPSIVTATECYVPMTSLITLTSLPVD